MILVVLGCMWGIRKSRDLRSYLDLSPSERAARPDLKGLQSRLMTMPAENAHIAYTMWLLAGVIGFAVSLFEEAIGVHRGLRIFIALALVAGPLASLLGFLISDAVRRPYLPAFFPDGAHEMPEATPHRKVGLRIFGVMAVVSTAPLLILGILAPSMIVHGADAGAPPDIDEFLMTASLIIPACLLLAAICSFLLARSVGKPLEALTDGIEALGRGDFSKRLAPAYNDEIGQLSVAYNQMAPTLAEHIRVQRSMAVAEEIQQSLLPQKPPLVPGLDIYGTSRYCEALGGDYYDVLGADETGCSRPVFLVGDVAGHGLEAALLMISARALLRQSLFLEADIAACADAVNRWLAADVGASGRFMTMFLCEYEMADHALRWVRAEHDPAIVYDSAGDEFDELAGSGLPLGVMTEVMYSAYEATLEPGKMLLIGTDGIWELRNDSGEMFGKSRLREILRAGADKPAKAVAEAVFSALDEWRGDRPLKHDVTMIVVKTRKPQAG